MDHCETKKSTRITACPIMTPSSVPKFCIPSRCPRSFSKTNNTSSLLIPRHPVPKLSSSNWPVPESTKLEQEDDHLAKPQDVRSTDLLFSTNDTKHEIWSESDPGMKLSMTYVHIPILKTPYGFPVLKHSPENLKRETILLGAKYRNRKTQQFPDKSSPRSLMDCKLEKTEMKLMSEVNLNTNGAVSKGKRETVVHKSPANHSNSLQFSTTCTYPPSPVPSTTSASIIRPVRKESSVPMRRVSALTRESYTDVDRQNALNRLRMLVAGQTFAAKARDLGDIEIELQYNQSSKRLRVRVIQANGVGLTSKNTSQDINTHVQLYLMPDKQQRRQTEVVKGTCDPTYNENFFFNISPHELILSGLVVRVLKTPGFLFEKWPAKCIGEATLDLSQLKYTLEVFCSRQDLILEANKQATRMLNISICYRSRMRKLCITVIRAHKLAKTGFLKTAPDCRVKVEVTQVKDLNLSTVVKRSGLRRRTRNPVFKELMSFDINDLNNLRDGMTVVCTLLSPGLMGNAQTLGQVRFGLGSSRATEKLQWANVLRNPGYSITQWHTL